MSEDREYTGVHAQFINASLEVASTFLDIAAAAYSSNNRGRGDRAIVRASRSLGHAARFLERLATMSPVTAVVLQDKLMVLCQKRDRLSGRTPANVIEFPAA